MLNIFVLPINLIPSMAFTSVSALTKLSKFDADLNHILAGCELLPFEELKEIFSERFSQVDEGLDKNFKAIKENLKAIHINYEAIIALGSKVDRNLKVMEFGFNTITN